ncbi:LytR family transcriptional attenuator [Aureibacillus halotolerans]|uniref:LytR family transcriptional attenuator n=2 Tax=Aureibacillus halotolerans TaxID=1508390 RepID=A0A4R6TY19_9BACI|nr:LytR family transcriptional attenuator [Aureibacillus halotolerans]
MNSRHGNRSKRKKKIWFLILTPILVIGIVATSYAVSVSMSAKEAVNNAQQEIEGRETTNKSELREEVVDPNVDNISILFMGIDDSTNRGYGASHARTDALLLATFNETDKSVKVVSIPRDSYVEIVGRDFYDKINHAHAFGGIDMTVNTVEQFLDVPVDYYVRLNFNAFMSIVNTLGGVTVDVPFEFTEQDSEDVQGAITLQEGLQQLNGEEALAFARTRVDSDYQRGIRQQQIIEAIIKKSMSFESLTKFDDVFASIGDNLTTNMSFDEMMSFHDYILSGSTPEVEHLTLIGEATYIRNNAGQDIYYYKVQDQSLQEVKDSLQAHLDLNDTTSPSTTLTQPGSSDADGSQTNEIQLQ